MSVTQAAQAVQHSAYPDAYADDEQLAESLLADSGLADGTGPRPRCPRRRGRVARTTSATCRTSSTARSRCPSLPRLGSPTAATSAPAVAAGRVATPAPTSLSPCGTPVRAATRRHRHHRARPGVGRALARQGQHRRRSADHLVRPHAVPRRDRPPAWSGRARSSVRSAAGATPPAATCTSRSIRSGGSIYEDGVDPTEWLQTHVGQEEPGGAGRRSGAAEQHRARPRRARS